MQDSMQTGVWQTWWENGQLADSGEYVPLHYNRIKVDMGGENSYGVDTNDIKKNYLKRSVYNGHWVSYFPNGAMQEVADYFPIMTVHISFIENIDPVSGESGIAYVMIDEPQRTGTWKMYYENGKLQSEAVYVNGVKNGAFSEYYENGNLQLSGEIYNGGKNKNNYNESFNGPYKEFFEDGSLSAEKMYDKGEAAGVWKEYYPGGKIKSTEDHTNSYGYEHKDYYENGNLKLVCAFTGSDQKNGKYAEYYETGAKKNRAVLCPWQRFRNMVHVL